MKRVLLALVRADGVSRERFGEALGAHLASLRDAPGPPAAWVEHRALPDDALLGGRGRPQRLDALLACEGASAEALRLAPPEALCRVASACEVETSVHWDRCPAGADGDWTPGVKVVYWVRRRADLAPDAFERRYREGHTRVAREHHPGVCRYAQSFVRRRTAGDAPAFDAVSELSFASEEDLRERFYRDETSQRIVGEDIAAFLDVRAGFAVAMRERIWAG